MIKSVSMLVAAALFQLAFVPQANAQSKNDLSDAEVASVAVVANQIDINYGKLAQKKSKNAEVLQFAKTMINDHTAVIGQASALVKKLGVTPKSNKVTQGLLSDSRKTTKMLQSKSGAAFNKAYIDNEVAYHKAVIGAVETVLIPETDNAELKSLLQNILPALKAHLQHAEMVQAKLARP